MTTIKLYGGATITIEDSEKVSYSRFLQIAGLEDRPRSRDLYSEYEMSAYDDVGMFLANFRDEG